MRLTYFAAMLLFFIPAFCFSDARIKDVVNFEGIRDNMLIGHGLVVGLNGTGDNLKNAIFTEKSLSDFLERMGVNTKGGSLKTKNVAAVTVTATLPPFARSGNRVSVNVSTLGDAKSLKGGTLLATTLLGADGEVYAIAQGPVSVGSPSDSSDKNAKYNPTSGYIINGAIIEREVYFPINDMKEIKLSLKNPDITTANAISIAINSSIYGGNASVLDPGTVLMRVPQEYQGNVMSLLSNIELLEIAHDSVAKIVIDEATGTIVIGDNTTISPVAIAQGNLTIQMVDDESEIAQYLKNPLDTKKPKMSKPGEKIGTLERNTKLSDVVEGLNALGVTTKDLIVILKTLQNAGALQAELEIR